VIRAAQQTSALELDRPAQRGTVPSQRTSSPRVVDRPKCSTTPR